MSLFRTLQNSPATISIFHNTKIPLSSALYQVLEKADNKINSGKRVHFQVDVMANKMPTFSQYQSLASSFIPDLPSRHILNSCYPFLYDQKIAGDKASVTMKGVEPTKIFNEGEYQLIYEVFNNSIESKDHPHATIQGLEIEEPEQIFSAPLIVDWDQNLIAGDEESLAEILKKYQH